MEPSPAPHVRDSGSNGQFFASSGGSPCQPAGGLQGREGFRAPNRLPPSGPRPERRPVRRAKVLMRHAEALFAAERAAEEEMRGRAPPSPPI